MQIRYRWPRFRGEVGHNIGTMCLQGTHFLEPIMGLFWDLIQQNQISNQSSRTSSLESRIDRLELQMHETNQLLQTLLERLEKYVQSDIDGDGRIGGPAR